MSRLNAILEENDEQTSGFGITTDCGSSLRSNCDSPLHRGDTFSTAFTNFSNPNMSVGNADVFYTPSFNLKGSSIRSRSRKKSKHHFENTPRFKRMRKVFSLVFFVNFYYLMLLVLLIVVIYLVGPHFYL